MHLLSSIHWFLKKLMDWWWKVSSLIMMMLIMQGLSCSHKHTNTHTHECMFVPIEEKVLRGCMKPSYSYLYNLYGGSVRATLSLPSLDETFHDIF